MADKAPMATVDGPTATRPATLTGVTELRVHGVGGTTPETMLRDLDPRRVAGDRVAGFFRTVDHPEGWHREAYSWGGLTSRSRWRALWVLMLPAMFANMAGWGARRRLPGTLAEGGPPTSRSFRFQARLLALGLSIMTAASVAYVLIDVVAVRWGGSGCCGSTWLVSDVLRWLLPADDVVRRMVVGALVAVATCLGMWLLSRVSESRYEEYDADADAVGVSGRSSAAADDEGLAGRRFWSNTDFHRQLTTCHLAVGVTVPTLVLGWSRHRLDVPDGWGLRALDWWELAALAGSVAALLCAAYLMRRDDAVRGIPTGMAWVAWGSFLVIVISTWQDGPADQAGAWALTGAAEVTLVAWSVGLLATIALVARRHIGRSRGTTVENGADPQDRTQEADDSAPWTRWTVFPWSAAATLGLLGIVTMQFVMLALIARLAAASEKESVPPVASEADGSGPLGVVHDLAPAARSASALLVLVGIVGLLALVWWAVRNAWRPGRGSLVPRATPAEVRQSLLAAYRTAGRLPDPPGDVHTDGEMVNALHDRTWVKKAAMFRRLSRASRPVGGWLVAMAVTGYVVLALGLAASAPWLADWGFFSWWLGWDNRFVRGLNWLALGAPVAAVGLIAATWRSVGLRRTVGVLFDVGTFLPRAYHPFAPPSYAERAVPELRQRVQDIHEAGGRVVLVCHSQGSIVVSAAVRPPECLSDDVLQSVRLVTYGSPLTTLYHWAFPTVFDRSVMEALARRFEGAGRSWDNLFFATDYVGGAVDAGGSPAVTNVELPDPPGPWYRDGDAPPTVLTHTGYSTSADFRAWVDSLCRRELPPDPPVLRRPGGRRGASRPPSLRTGVSR